MSSLQTTHDAQLTPKDARDLTVLEGEIRKHLGAFKQAGAALWAISERQLYRETHATFREYVADRWNMGKSQAYRLIAAAETADQVSPSGDAGLTIATEAQARELGQLEPQQKQAAWDRAVDAADGEAPTGPQVAKAVGEVTGRTQTADVLASSESNEHYTPSIIVEAARELMGGIDLDPASCAEANETVRAEMFYDQSDGGLSLGWPGRVFLNPPYGWDESSKQPGKSRSGVSNQQLWSQALFSGYGQGVTTEAVGIFGARIGEAWFQPLWGHCICFPRRVAFNTPGGGVGTQPNGATAIVYLGPQVERFVEIFSEIGQCVIPGDWAATSIRRPIEG